MTRARRTDVVDRRAAELAVRPVHRVIGSLRQHVALLEVSAVHGEPTEQIAEYAHAFIATLRNCRKDFDETVSTLHAGAASHSAVTDTRRALDDVERALRALAAKRAEGTIDPSSQSAHPRNGPGIAHPG